MPKLASHIISHRINHTAASQLCPQGVINPIRWIVAMLIITQYRSKNQTPNNRISMQITASCTPFPAVAAAATASATDLFQLYEFLTFNPIHKISKLCQTSRNMHILDKSFHIRIVFVPNSLCLTFDSLHSWSGILLWLVRCIKRYNNFNKW